MPDFRTEHPIRDVSAEDLGIGLAQAIEEHASNSLQESALPDDDPRLDEVVGLLDDFGGVIFSGPPGTSKTWYAAKIAYALTDGEPTQTRFVQFHPSYQYEDFMQGFVPRKDADGFVLTDKHFVDLCSQAGDHPDKTYVLVIDELSRGDAGRIFGEALTYVERSKRGLPFSLASGDDCVVPDNLVILATMNPLDRGVDEVDAAFERRFAKIAMEPDEALLQQALELNGVDPDLVINVMLFFRALNGKARKNPQAAVGHTFLIDVQTVEDVRRVWRYQLRFLIEKAFRLDPEAGEDVISLYRRLFEAPPTQTISPQSITLGQPDVTSEAAPAPSEAPTGAPTVLPGE